MTPLALPSFSSANISAVTERICIGGDLDMYDDDLVLDQIDEIFDEGITHIIDCRIEADDQELWDETTKIDYLHHGMDDVGQVVPGEWFDIGVGYLREALADPKARVLSHCHMGINRGPSLGFALMLSLGWDPVAAVDAIRAARPIAFVSYAEDALLWHHHRTGASVAEKVDQLTRLAQWRRADTLDIDDVIRQIRDREEG